MPGHIRSIGKRKDKSTIWQVRWRPPGDVTDVQRIEKVFRTKKDAERWMSTMEADALRGSFIDPRHGQVLLAAVAEEYRQTWGRLAPKTRVGYESILNRHVLPAFGSTQVARIQAQHVQEFHNDLASRRAPNTVRRVMDVLRGVLDLAVKRHYIAANPADQVELARRSRGIDIAPLTHEQVQQLTDHLPEHWRLPVLLTAYMGLRAGELWALRRESVHPTELAVTHALKEVTVQQAQDTPADERLTDSLIIGPTKTHAARKVSLPEFLRADLAAAALAVNPGEFIFTTTQGAPVRHNQFSKRIFRPAAKLVRPQHPPRFHDLRHTCAAWLIDAGAHPLQIKLRLGHESIRTTMDTYGHLFPSAEPELAALLDTARTESRTYGDLGQNTPSEVLRRTPRGNLGETAPVQLPALSSKTHD